MSNTDPAIESLATKLQADPFHENFSPEERKILMQWEDERSQRAMRVGVLLRDMHYLHSSEPPKAAKFYETETDYWTRCARSAPGLDEDKVRKSLERRRSGERKILQNRYR
jgi:hypothetical protein